MFLVLRDVRRDFECSLDADEGLDGVESVTAILFTSRANFNCEITLCCTLADNSLRFSWLIGSCMLLVPQLANCVC